MTSNSRFHCTTVLSLFLVPALAGLGCKDDPPPPKPEAQASSSALSPAKARFPSRTVNPAMRLDPQFMKDVRAETCYFGTLTLKQARDSYLASLKGEEPSEKRIPSFGIQLPAIPGIAPSASTPPSIAPKTSVSAAPAAALAPSASARAPSLAPSGSASVGSPTAPPPGLPPRFDFNLRAPYERNAMACRAASVLKEPPMPDIDAALGEFAPYAVDLAKTISTASIYYARDDWKNDKLAQGKDLHKKLVDGFAKLDAQSEKLGAAVIAWHKAHPPDLASMDEGERAAQPALDAARALIALLAPAKKDVEAWKVAEAKLATETETFRTFGKAHEADVFCKVLLPAFDEVLKRAKEADPKLTPAGLEAEPFLNIVGAFVTLLEARQRAHLQAARPGPAPGIGIGPVASVAPANVVPPTVSASTSAAPAVAPPPAQP